MSSLDPFLTVAEIALGLTGFTGIVVVFGRRPGERVRADAYRLIMLLVPSLGALFLSLIPAGLQLVGMSDAGVIRLSSGLMAVYNLGSSLALAPRARRIYREARALFSGWMTAFVAVGTVVNVTIQALNSFVLAHPSAGIYFFGLLWFLLFGSLQFARLLFIRPGPGKRSAT